MGCPARRRRRRRQPVGLRRSSGCGDASARAGRGGVAMAEACRERGRGTLLPPLDCTASSKVQGGPISEGVSALVRAEPGLCSCGCIGIAALGASGIRCIALAQDRGAQNGQHSHLLFRLGLQRRS